MAGTSKPRCLVVLSLLLFVCAPLSGGPACAAPQKSLVSSDQTQIEISLRPTRKAFRVGAPIQLTLEITNIGSVPVMISKEASVNFHADISTGSHLDLELLDSKSRKGSTLGFNGDSFGIPSKAPPIATLLQGWILLPPETSYKSVLSINSRMFDSLSSPGAYVLVGSYSSPDLFDPSTARILGLSKADLDAIPARCWSGKLKLNPIQIEVLAK